MPQTNPRILIIEDEKGIVLAIEGWIKQHGKTLANITIDNAPTLALGKERARDAHLIILDLSLPDSPSPEFTMEAVPDLRLSAPVVILTGREDSEYPVDRSYTIEGISELGAEMVLYKSMIHTKEGMDWLMLCLQSAFLRRAYQLKHNGGGSPNKTI
jgi:DNA-binding NarL/FixJ family response regulator